jgi:hypothetical protein
MKKWRTLLLICLWLTGLSLKSFSQLEPNASVAACDSLSTVFTANNAMNGNMFDIVSFSQVYIIGFDVNTNVSGMFYVYYKTGSYIGYVTDSTVWTFLDTATVTTNGPNVPSSLMLHHALQLSDGITMAIYIFSGSPVRYTDGNAVGNVAASNADMQILEGEGCSAHWGGSHYSPRVWNGKIFYCDGTIGVNDLFAEKKIICYPNPASDFLQFNVPVNYSSMQLILNVTDAAGRQVAAVQKNYSGQMQFNISKLESGLYFYTVYSRDEIIDQGKFCKQ